MQFRIVVDEELALEIEIINVLKMRGGEMICSLFHQFSAFQMLYLYADLAHKLASDFLRPSCC